MMTRVLRRENKTGNFQFATKTYLLSAILIFFSFMVTIVSLSAPSPRLACLDDIRVSHHQLPLPPAVNGTPWGQVTTQQHLLQGCHPPGKPCANTTCAAPLSCRAVWDQPSCR